VFIFFAASSSSLFVGMHLWTSDVLKRIKDGLPCRETHVEELAFKISSGWPVIMVFGQRGSGKSSLVHSLVKASSLPTSLIDLATGSSVRDVYTTILSDLKYSIQSELLESTPLELYFQSECSDAADFVAKVHAILPPGQGKGSSRMIVVLDSAQVLLDMEPTFINSLSKLEEWLKDSIKLQIILISSLPPHSFQRPEIFLTPVLTVSLESYTREQLTTILRHRGPKTSVYDNYIQIIVGALYDVTRSVSDMSHAVDDNLPLYMDPVIRGEASESDSTKLWKNFEPHVKKLASCLGLVEDVIPDDLPYATRFLLIAAFLVSFNCKSTDKRFFVKNQSGRHIARTLNKKEGKGPKAFTLERLLHVYQSLLSLNYEFDEENESSSIITPSRLMMPSTEIMSHLEDLASLKLVLKVGTPSFSSIKKWKISDSVTFDYIQGIASTLNFDLESHLEQYAFKK